MNFKHLWRLIFAVSLASSLALVSSAATNPRIIPFQSKVSFSADASGNAWSVPIKSTSGRTIYVLSLEPDFYVGKRVEGVDLILRRTNSDLVAPNLLAPIGIWHGLQAYMFPAQDFLQGVKGTVFGERRTISARRLGLVIKVTVSDAKISQTSSGYIQLDALELQVEVDNSSQ
jgi:hypothetical protein